MFALKKENMTPDPLDEILRDYSQQSVPRAPDGLRAGIWREIERRRSGPGLLGLLWPNLRQRPAMALAALAVAVLAGVWPVASSRFADEQAHLARASLHFEVFSADASSVLAASMRTIPQGP